MWNQRGPDGVGHWYSWPKLGREPSMTPSMPARTSRASASPAVRGAPADLEVADTHPHGFLARGPFVASEAPPALVDRDDAAVPVQDGDVAGQGFEDGRLDRLAGAQGVLGPLAGEGAGEHVGQEVTALNLLLRPGSTRRYVEARARLPRTCSPATRGMATRERMPIRCSTSLSAAASSGTSWRSDQATNSAESRRFAAQENREASRTDGVGPRNRGRSRPPPRSGSRRPS